MAEEPKSIRIVMNEAAASDEELRIAVETLRDGGYRVDVRVTWESGQGELFAAEAVRNGVDVVVAAGGDGTVNEVVNGLFRDTEGSVPAVGVLPYGTGNDFAIGLGMEEADGVSPLWQILKRSPVPMDAGRVKHRLFVNMATAGFGAQVTAETPPDLKRIFGRAAYGLEALARSFDLQAHHMRIEAPNFDWAGGAYLVCVGNGRTTGGGWQVCPKAKLDDGLLDLLIIPEMPSTSVVALTTIIRRGRHLEDERVIYRQAPWIDIEADEMLQVNLDGEPLCGRHFRFSAQERVLPMLIDPEKSLLSDG